MQNRPRPERIATILREMRAELLGPAPTPLERLLVERAVGCWLQMQYADATYAQAREISLTHLDYLGRRQNQAHRRFLTAVGALVTLQRLLPNSMTAAGSRPSASQGASDGQPALAIYAPPSDPNKRRQAGGP
ncbi:hypothetical protein BH23PLA1_BH23PLA1_27320 [soil metagenome]